VERYGDQVLTPEWGPERERLAVMAEVCDPATIALLERVGVPAGSRCLEVGGGGGSIAAWMAGRAGHVVATDLDIRFLRERSAPNLEVLRHDVVRDPDPGGPFDLIHARFVLEHLPEREMVLDRLVSWLAPGGVVAIESIAEFPIATSPHPEFRAAMTAIGDVLAQTIGTDSRWARSFPGPLRGRGLDGLGAQVNLPTTGGGNASARCWSLTLAQLRPRILELGLATAAELDQAAAMLDDPGFFDLGFATVVCWGSKRRR